MNKRSINLSGETGFSRDPDDSWDFSSDYAADIIFSANMFYGTGSYVLKSSGNGSNGKGIQIDFVSIQDTGSFYSISASFGSSETGSTLLSFVPSADIIDNGDFGNAWGGVSENAFSTVPDSWGSYNDSANAYVTESTIHPDVARIYTNGSHSGTDTFRFIQPLRLIPNRVYWLSYDVVENYSANVDPLTLYLGPGLTGSGHSIGTSYLTLSCDPGNHSLTFSFETYDDRTTRSMDIAFYANGSYVDVGIGSVILREAHSSSNQIVKIIPGDIYYSGISRNISTFSNTSSNLPLSAETSFFVYRWNSDYESQSFDVKGFATSSAFEYSSVSQARFPLQPTSIGHGRKIPFSLDGSRQYQTTVSGIDTSYHHNYPCNIFYMFNKYGHTVENIAHPSTESILTIYDEGIFVDEDIWGNGSIDPRLAKVTSSNVVAANYAGVTNSVINSFGSVDGSTYVVLHGSSNTDSQMAGLSSVHGHKAFTVAAWTKIDEGQYSPTDIVNDNNCILRIGDGDYTSASLAAEFDASPYRTFTVSGYTNKTNALCYSRKWLPPAATFMSDAPYASAKGTSSTGIWFGLSKDQSAPFDDAGILPTLYFNLYSSDTYQNSPLNGGAATVNDEPSWTLFRARYGGLSSGDVHMTQSSNEWWLTLYSVRVSTSDATNLDGYTPVVGGRSIEGLMEIYMFRAPASQVFNLDGSITSSSIFDMELGDNRFSGSKNQLYTIIAPQQDLGISSTASSLGGDLQMSGSNAVVLTSEFWCSDMTASTDTDFKNSDYYSGSSFSIGTGTDGNGTFSGLISSVFFMPDTYVDHNNIQNWLKQVGPGGLTPPIHAPASFSVIESGTYGYSLHDAGHTTLSRSVISQKNRYLNSFMLDQEALNMDDSISSGPIGII